MKSTPFVNEYGFIAKMSPGDFDDALASGWRHFGDYFFRYSEMTTEDQTKLTIQPLRLTVPDFVPSKSQLRIWRKNEDVSLRIGPTRVSPELITMFEEHKQRFVCNIPNQLADFLGETPGEVVPNLSFQVYLGSKLIAASFLDVGRTSVSSVYAMFDPRESRRSLGYFTMLAEIQWCAEQQFAYYYPGYGSVEPSVYDYKKTLHPLDRLCWASLDWVPLER